MIGVPDAYRGETPKAFVKLKSGAPPLTLDDLKAFLKDRLGKHEMISALEIRAELPKTPVGKISKKDLRAGRGGAGGDAAGWVMAPALRAEIPCEERFCRESGVNCTLRLRQWI